MTITPGEIIIYHDSIEFRRLVVAVVVALLVGGATNSLPLTKANRATATPSGHKNNSQTRIGPPRAWRAAQLSLISSSAQQSTIYLLGMAIIYIDRQRANWLPFAPFHSSRNSSANPVKERETH